MNAPERLALPDIQSQIDGRNIAIDAVGVNGVRYPITIASEGKPTSTLGTYSMTVGLSASAKGTHMSRFIELLEAAKNPIGQTEFITLGLDMLSRLDATYGTIEVKFPYFIRKTAPVSQVQSLLDVDVGWKAVVSTRHSPIFSMRVVVAATSLCPCSKEISAYGAHNQRSHIVIDAEINGDMSIEELISVAEQGASCEVYGLLKRVDEKYVTERAYDNPKFVEDLARDIAVALNAEHRVDRYCVEVENFESIHNHSAVARINNGAQRGNSALRHGCM
ncbi:GTP cyclohydrolase I FolE2 [Noviherbaspirillum saxi]|uniref:GTP cyclohydrolase FolE2 n=2 Tax=Noviherbaspirillum saxi TaxID=2320863 RepID=A0A3A3FKV9_9BURK|nr:GTP cyclohydrolase I FolE2 [Noviherbaspirillum saxi]